MPQLFISAINLTLKPVRITISVPSKFQALTPVGFDTTNTFQLVYAGTTSSTIHSHADPVTATDLETDLRALTGDSGLTVGGPDNGPWLVQFSETPIDTISADGTGCSVVTTSEDDVRPLRLPPFRSNNVEPVVFDLERLTRSGRGDLSRLVASGSVILCATHDSPPVAQMTPDNFSIYQIAIDRHVRRVGNFQLPFQNGGLTIDMTDWGDDLAPGNTDNDGIDDFFARRDLINLIAAGSIVTFREGWTFTNISSKTIRIGQLNDGNEVLSIPPKRISGSYSDSSINFGHPPTPAEARDIQLALSSGQMIVY